MNWFEKRKRQETASAARLIVAGFAVLVIVVAIASMAASVVMP